MRAHLVSEPLLEFEVAATRRKARQVDDEGEGRRVEQHRQRLRGGKPASKQRENKNTA